MTSSPCSFVSVLSLSLAIASVSSLGCSDDGRDAPPTGGGGTGAVGGGGTTPVGGSGGSGGTVDPPETERQTLTGEATWTVTFDADAQTAGATDCSYTRSYQGVQDESRPWLCPACDTSIRATVAMTAGEQDCFSQVSADPPVPDEWVGWGGGVFWRGRGANMTDQGTATVTADTVQWSNLVEDLEATVIGAGTMQFDVAGQFTLAIEEGDPMHGWAAASSYSCGWPKAGPPAYQGDYTLQIGTPLPDGLFKDSCDEIVRLHDFQGTYLLVNLSAINCPSCQGMADQEEAFIANMAGQGIDVTVVTLLVPLIEDALGEVTATQLNAWMTNHGLSSPVLADRAWGISMFLPLQVDHISFPSWVLARPDLTVFHIEEGFTSFASIESIIQADAP